MSLDPPLEPQKISFEVCFCLFVPWVGLSDPGFQLQAPWPASEASKIDYPKENRTLWMASEIDYPEIEKT